MLSFLFLSPSKKIAHFGVAVVIFSSCIYVGQSLAFTHPSQVYSLSKANIEAKAKRRGRSGRDRVSNKTYKNKPSDTNDYTEGVYSSSHTSGSTALHQAVLAESESENSGHVEFVKEESDNDVKPKLEPPLDMKYTMENTNRQREQYQAMTNLGGNDMIHDVYVRHPSSHTFWYCGKISCCSGTATLEQCVQRQWNMIEEHAARLRNLELGPHFGSLEIWTAPGNSEMDVAYNRPSITFQKHHRLTTQDEIIHNKKIVRRAEVGFLGEVYEGGEEGFRTERNDDGSPRKPEINGPP